MRKSPASVAILAAIGVASCANLHDRFNPGVVKVPVPVACPDRRGPAPNYPDTKAAIAHVPRGDMKTIEELQTAGRVLRDQRLAEDDAQIAACAAPIK